VRDEFNISTELKIVCASWAVLLLPWLLINLVAQAQDKNTPFPTVYLLIAWTVISQFASIWWPTYRSFFDTPEVNFEEQFDVLNSFDSVLNHQASLETFKEFLVSDISVENLTFYLDVESFKGITNKDEIVMRSVEIYLKYFKAGAMFALNLDSEVINPIQKHIQKLIPRVNIIGGSLLVKKYPHSIQVAEEEDVMTTSMADVRKSINKGPLSASEISNLHNIYNDAQACCYSLMKTNSYPRFKNHALCRKLIEGMRKAESEKFNLEELKIVPTKKKNVFTIHPDPNRSSGIIDAVVKRTRTGSKSKPIPQIPTADPAIENHPEPESEIKPPESKPVEKIETNAEAVKGVKASDESEDELHKEKDEHISETTKIFGSSQDF